MIRSDKECRDEGCFRRRSVMLGGHRPIGLQDSVSTRLCNMIVRRNRRLWGELHNISVGGGKAMDRILSTDWRKAIISIRN
jgi:hypothetical protein